MQKRNLKSVMICAAYRPPNCPTTCFVEDFGPAYAKALSFNTDIVICGDLNCNMLSRDDPNAQALRSFCTSMNLVQLIGNPTRVT